MAEPLRHDLPAIDRSSTPVRGRMPLFADALPPRPLPEPRRLVHLTWFARELRRLLILALIVAAEIAFLGRFW